MGISTGSKRSIKRRIRLEKKDSGINRDIIRSDSGIIGGICMRIKSSHRSSIRNVVKEGRNSIGMGIS